jgi:hypothetical protein
MAGDIRGEGAAILQQLWDALGWPEDVSDRAGVVTRYGVRIQGTFLASVLTSFEGLPDLFEPACQPCRQSLRQPP